MAANDKALDQAMQTINPADLFIPCPDQRLAQAQLDADRLIAFDSQGILPTEPIWIANQSSLPQQQQDQWQEQRPWYYPNGDSNYSSYASSPADNSLGLHLLEQRFGQYHIGAAGHASFEQLALSRDTSFSCFEQQSSSPGIQQPRHFPARRGRILADMASPGPQTVYEDSDSHHSWTAADNVETWGSHLRERLTEFRRNKQRVSIITSHLQTRQRRKVHSMANLWGLSHTSLGTGREKRVLICKCEFSKSRAQMVEKRWNPSRDNWSPGLVDPRIVLFDLVSPKLVAGKFQECLREADLPVPVRVTIDCFNPMKPDMQQPVATAYAMFRNADDAALVLLALDGTKPNWNGLDVELECDYVHFPPGFNLSPRALENFDGLPEAVRVEKLRLQQGKVFTSFRARNSNSALYSDSESDNEMSSPGLSMHSSTSSRGLRSRGTSNESWYSRDPGYVSASSNRSAMYSDHSSQASSSKKRKRVPKISGGYGCTFQGCDRVFDRDGDRRKHEKNHAGERPHVCHKCGKAFLYPKDLRRHMIVHSITSLPSSNEDGAEAEEVAPVEKPARADRHSSRPQAYSSSPPLSEDQLKRLYGEVRPRDRRISKISLFGK